MGVYRSDPAVRLPPPGPAAFAPAGAAYLQQQGPRALQRLQCYFREYPSRDTYQRQELLPGTAPFAPAATAFPPAIGSRPLLQRCGLYWRDPPDVYLPAVKALPPPPPVLPPPIAREFESREYHRAPFVAVEPWPIAPPFLCYEQLRNLLTYTESLDNAAYTQTACTITANGATDPNGTSLADVLVETGGATEHKITRNLAMTANLDYTLSGYAKANGRDWLAVIVSGPGFNSVTAYFNVASGAVGTVTGTTGTAAIVAAANGYYRWSAMLNAGTDVGGTPSLKLLSSDVDGGGTQTGSGVSALNLWGLQFEQASVASAYQPILATNPPECAHTAPPPIWPLFPQARADARVRFEPPKTIQVAPADVPAAVVPRGANDQNYARAPYWEAQPNAVAPILTPTDAALFRGLPLQSVGAFARQQDQRWEWKQLTPWFATFATADPFYVFAGAQISRGPAHFREPDRARFDAPRILPPLPDYIIPMAVQSAAWRRDIDRARLNAQPFTISSDDPLPQPPNQTAALWRDAPRARFVSPVFTISSDDPLPAGPLQKAAYGRDERREPLPAPVYTISADSLLPQPVIASIPRREPDRAKQPVPPFTVSADTVLPAPIIASIPRREPERARLPVPLYTVSADTLPPSVLATPARRDDPRAGQPTSPFTPLADSLPPTVQPSRAAHLREPAVIRYQSPMFVFVAAQPAPLAASLAAHRRSDDRARITASSAVQPPITTVPPTEAQAIRIEERRPDQLAQPRIVAPAAELPPIERRDLTPHARPRVAVHPAITRVVPEQAEAVPPVSLPSAAYRRRADAPVAPRDLSVLFEEPMLLRGSAVAGAAYLRAESWVGYFRRYPLDARRPLLGLACLVDVSPNAALASSSPYGTLSLTGLAARLEANSPKATGAPRSPAGTITDDTPGCE